MSPTTPTVVLDDDVESIYDYFCEQGWTDGLPIIPPTPERVERVLRSHPGDPAEVMGVIPHLKGEATVERIAIAMVMAGCLPEHLPVVAAAVRATMSPRFNIQAVQSTTNAIAPLLILNGPVIDRLGFNARENVFGQGTRANATVGRAMRLILVNIGGADPGKLDRATHGHPGKYSYCVAENEDDSPWEPLHVERGFDRGGQRGDRDWRRRTDEHQRCQQHVGRRRPAQHRVLDGHARLEQRVAWGRAARGVQSRARRPHRPRRLDQAGRPRLSL